jgi:3-phosphoshikimate 1-carboxyvinyltransferase
VTRLQGVFQPAGDKSISHRIVVFSLLAEGRCRIQNLAASEDVRASCGAVEALGGRILEDPDAGILVHGLGGRTIGSGCTVHCENSGTTMRLLMGILAGRSGRFVLDGDASLRKRPMERVADPLRAMGAAVACTEGCAPVTIEGSALRGIDYTLPVPSAQLKSALLLAGVQARGDTTVREPMKSRDHSERLLDLCGAKLEALAFGWRIWPSPLRLPLRFRVPGDISSAAFFLCAAAVLPGSDLSAEAVLLNPTRTGFLEVLARMGAEVNTDIRNEQVDPWGSVRVRYTSMLTGCEVAANEIPRLLDEIPMLALTATQARGTTVFRNAGELRFKESDRLAVILRELGRLGARVRVRGDDLYVDGPTPLNVPERLFSDGDHRMAMTLRLAGLVAGQTPVIVRESCVAVSYPDFHATLRRLSA